MICFWCVSAQCFLWHAVTISVPVAILSVSSMVHFLFEFLDVLVADVIIVVHQFVDGAVGREFDDARGYGLNELVVVTGEEDVSLEIGRAHV